MSTTKSLVRTLAGHGFILLRSKRHMVFSHPCGARLVTSCSASDVRSIRNIEGDVRRLLRLHGVEA